MKLISTHNNTRLNFNEIGIIDIYAHKHWVNLKYFSAIKNQPKTFAFWFVTKKKYFDPTTHVKVFRNCSPILNIWHFFHGPRKKQKKQSWFVCKKKTQNLTSILRLSTILTQWAYGFIGKKTAEHICVLVCPWKKFKSTITQLSKHNSFVRKGRKI